VALIGEWMSGLWPLSKTDKAQEAQHVQA
jgi:hypothetical protein